MQHIIVGTAGHVDHGKTELTLRLTGINTDRLPEEKKRGMTIELGFVPLTLPNGQRLGLIDVPGHERFVKNMLAGVAGIDMVLLVIAADEGVMPQTLEHLHILHLLGIEKGIVVISKADLVDADWLELIREQIGELLAGTSLANVPVIATSAHTGQGIEELLTAMQQIAAEVKPKAASGHFRLPIDRVFSKVGFGTVITGTLWQGKLKLGENIEVWPGGHAARVRGLQVHGEKVEEALAGQRTAVNLAGLEVAELPRGGWLAAPKLLRESWRLDIELRLLPEVKTLSQRSRVRVHHGTNEVLARVHLLDREELEPGETCYCQLLLEKPLPPLRGDRIILRSYSPMLTIGGATVLDANPPRHKRYRPEVIEAMQQRSGAGPEELLLRLLCEQRQLFTLAALAKESQLPAAEVQPLLNQLLEAGRICRLGAEEAIYAVPEELEDWLDEIREALTVYHQQFPLRSGLALATVRAQYLPLLSQKHLTLLLEAWQAAGELKIDRSWLALPEFRSEPDAQQAVWLAQIEDAFAEQLFNPPDWQELVKTLRVPAAQQPELLLWLTERGKLQKLEEGLYFPARALLEAEQVLRQKSAPDGFTLAEARDWLGSSRKFVLAILEHFDREKITKRLDEKRVLL